MEANTHVRLKGNPGRHGWTTGRTRKSGSILLVQVNFGPNERLFKPCDLLEPVEPEDNMLDLMVRGKYGNQIDLRRVLTLAKVKGGLTNVFYSMETSNTDFYPHQFKPVMKFIESTVGRLLIADEVGLGKTIESIYIWKELQAREEARRLLIIVPAMLREKWRDDLQQRFGISAEIIDARGLVEKIENCSQRGFINHTFTLITSLEGLRTPKNFHDEDNTRPQAAFARLLDRYTVTEDLALFDLTIIDEAHYLRNQQTASNRLGRLVRDASRNLVLLTATPIQIKTGNLYQLLRLVDEEFFHDEASFEDILRANAPIISALRSIWRNDPIDKVRESIDVALANSYFADDPILGRVATRILGSTYDSAARVELGRLLGSRSLLGQYMTRSRKQEVFDENQRVKRAAQVLQVSFNPEERLVYNTITQNLRERIPRTKGMATFALCMRQRQMTSCLVAALEHWREWDLIEEVMSEDIGSSLRQENDARMNNDDMAVLLSDKIVSDIDIRTLETVDSKYKILREFLERELRERPNDKIVMFSFFRGTLSYLKRRLENDGVRTALIMGGMGDKKQDVLRWFSSPDGPSILLSSEVGSEGIDLQFCRLVVNYDLPWNPMRVEQRIGRLDRLGQMAEQISIVNLALQDTIEDRILLRLYDRISLFRDSIGELEEILGRTTEQLMLKLLSPDLTDEQREQLAMDSELAIHNKYEEQKRLECEAVNLIGFTDHILDSVSETHEGGRWLSGDELMAFVDDFFALNYPGTQINPLSNKKIEVDLSKEARADLADFVMTSGSVGTTSLHQRIGTSTCLFDPRQPGRVDTRSEWVDATHPLIQWICSRLKDSAVHQISAVDLCRSRTDVSPGMYTFVVHRWEFLGLRERRVLSFRVANLESNHVEDAKTSEKLVVTSSRYGTKLNNVKQAIGDLEEMAAVRRCEKALDSEYERLIDDFKAENEQQCNAQETSARRFSDRRIRELEDRLSRFIDNNQRHLVPMTEGLIRRERLQLEAKLKKVEKRRIVDSTMDPSAAGIIRVR